MLGEPQQERLGPGAGLALDQARTFCRHIGDRPERERIARRHHEALLAPHEGDQHRVHERAVGGDRGDVGAFVGSIDVVQMDAGDGRFAGAQTPQTRLAAFEEKCEARSGFA